MLGALLTETSLTWALLQERITSTRYPAPASILNPKPGTETFKFPIVLNTIQSLFASVTGALYLYSTTKASQPLTIFPTTAIIAPLLLVSITSSLASPFGYASLAHVDYLTFVLAKSCKLLPVMALHVTLFRTRYPLYKYCVVLAVTLGVALFTLYHPSTASKKSKHATSGRMAYGLTLLGINLLFDGLTNTVQDHVFKSPARYGRFSGPQMMVAQNLISTALTITYLLLTPYVPTNNALASHFLSPSDPTATHELSLALAFLQRHPRAFYDVLGFCACGAIGQVFIYYTLSKFSSLLLVTVTVTRKMLTMLLSVVWFGKRLTGGQWAGVGLVFGGIGAEAAITRNEKQAKEKAKLGKSS